MRGSFTSLFSLVAVATLSSAFVLLASCSEQSSPPPSENKGGASGMDTCSDDAECEDGLFCNGEEVCSSGTCSAGVSPCLDTQTCNESSELCESDCGSEPDADGDGHDALNCGGSDCDDADGRRFPGNTEVCDDQNLDEDCDTTTFGSRDEDSDGYSDALCCNDDTCGDDCDDKEANVHPTEGEVCDGLDNDCDGDTDENIPMSSLPRWYPDADGDGARDAGVPGTSLCVLENPGYTLDTTDDCDETDAERAPGFEEICDGKDNDCDPGTLGCIENLTTGLTSQISVSHWFPNGSGVLKVVGTATETVQCPEDTFAVSWNFQHSSCPQPYPTDVCLIDLNLTCGKHSVVDEAQVAYAASYTIAWHLERNGEWNGYDKTSSIPPTSPTGCSPNQVPRGGQSTSFALCSTATISDMEFAHSGGAGAGNCPSDSLPVGFVLNGASESVNMLCAAVGLSE